MFTKSEMIARTEEKLSQLNAVLFKEEEMDIRAEVRLLAGRIKRLHEQLE
jgi:hypothetical protein